MAKKSRVWDGTAWQELASAQTDLTAYSTTEQMNTAITAGVGLVPILTQNIGTAVSSVVVNNAFSADYDNYKIVASDGVATVDGSFIALTLGATTTGYYQAMNQVTYANVGATRNTSNGANFVFGIAAINGMFGNAELFLPFKTKRTIMNTIFSEPATGGFYRVGSGYLNDATSYTDFTLTFLTGTMTGGTIKVYGYKN